jgi:hypothetical protein
MAIDKNTIYVANESFTTQEGISFIKDSTRVSGAWLAKHKEFEGVFIPLEVHYDVEKKAEPKEAKTKVEAATAGPGEKRK